MTDRIRDAEVLIFPPETVNKQMEYMDAPEKKVDAEKYSKIRLSYGSGPEGYTADGEWESIDIVPALGFYSLDELKEELAVYELEGQLIDYH